MFLKFDLSVHKMLYALLTALKRLNFCCLLRLIIISCVHGAFPLSINVHAQTLELQKSLLRKHN